MSFTNTLNVEIYNGQNKMYAYIYSSMYWSLYCILDQSYQWHIFYFFFFLHAFRFKKEQSSTDLKEEQIILCHSPLTPLLPPAHLPPLLAVRLTWILAASRNWMMTLRILKKNCWLEVLLVRRDMEGSCSSRPALIFLGAATTTLALGLYLFYKHLCESQWSTQESEKKPSRFTF